MNANLKKTLVTGSVTALMIGILALVILTLHSCGSGSSDNSSPVYDENGVCVENCGNNGDASVTSQDSYENGDTPLTYADGKPIPQQDTTPYVCPMNEPPEMCTPKWDEEPVCDLFATPPVCYRGFFEGQPCATDADCQKVPPDKYPPCVCWDFCGFFGEWDCGDGEIRKLSFLPDEGDGLCHFGEGSEALPGILGKPGDPNPRYPLDGEPKTSYKLSPDGQTLTSLTSMVTCTKL